jgi:energy-coupling factor transporter ATP-binding protein EcfA2
MRLHPGEVEATGWRVEKLSDVLERLRDAAPDVVGRPRLIAIDGRGGSGKSTLVERLRGLVPASEVVHTDDVAWNHAYFDWGNLTVENILRPLHRGEAVDFRPPAWIGHGRPGTIRVPAGADVVWVEGTGIIREEFVPWIDASMWVQGDLDEQERRLVARDGDSAEQQQHVAAWLAEELPLMFREQPWQKATVVVAGTPDLDYNRDTEVVVAPPAAS